MTGPIRLSQIKYSVYGGLRFDRDLNITAEFQPSIGFVAKGIDKLGMEFENFLDPIVKSIRLVMMPSIRKNFLMEGRPDEWERLAPYTEKVRGSARPILYRTGNLERAAASFSIWSITPTSAMVKDLPSDVWYGAIHQGGYGSLASVARQLLGKRATASRISELATKLLKGEVAPTDATRSTKVVIPARPFILFQDDDIEAIQEIFIDWMEDKANELGRGWNPL